MSTAEYGTVTLYLSWLQIITIIVTFRITYGAFYNGMIRYPNDKDGYTSSVLSLTTLLLIVWGIIYYALRNYINSLLDLDTTLMILMLIEIYFSSVFTIWVTRQRYEYNYKLQTLFTVILAVTAPILGVIFVTQFDDKIIGRILSFIIAGAIVGLYSIVSILKCSRKVINIEYWKFTILFCIPLIPHFLSQTILAQVDRLMINSMVGIEAVALYGFAYNVAMIPNIVVISINNSFVPWVYQKMSSKEYLKIKKISDVLIITIGCITCVMSMIVPEIVLFMGGRQYYEAIYCMPPIAVSVFFIFVYGIFCNIELFYEKNKLVMFASLGTGILNIFLNLVFIKLFGYIAAAYTTLVCYILLAIINYILMSRICIAKHVYETIYNVKLIIVISVCVVLFSILETILYDYPILRYIEILLLVFIGILTRKKIISAFNTIKNRD